MEEYTKEELWGLYKQLPNNLKEAVFSKEIGTAVLETTKNFNIKEESAKAILKMTGYVFLGILSPSEFKDSLKKDLNIEERTAEEIFIQISNDVFLDLKKELDLLYGINIQKEDFKKSKPIIKRKDSYLEPIN